MSNLIQQLLHTPPMQRFASLIMRARHIFFVGLFCVLFGYLLLSLLSYSATDTAWSHVSGMNLPVGQVNEATASNIVGLGGAWIADMLYMFFGVGAWAVLLWVAYEIYYAYCQKTSPISPLRLVAYMFLWACVSVLLYAWAFLQKDDSTLGLKMGGIIGFEAYGALANLLGATTTIIFVALGIVIVGVLLVDWRHVVYQDESVNRVAKPKKEADHTLAVDEPIFQATPQPAYRPEGVLDSFLEQSGLRAAFKKQLGDDDEADSAVFVPKPKPKLKPKMRLLTDYGDGLVADDDEQSATSDNAGWRKYYRKILSSDNADRQDKMDKDDTWTPAPSDEPLAKPAQDIKPAQKIKPTPSPSSDRQAFEGIDLSSVWQETIAVPKSVPSVSVSPIVDTPSVEPPPPSPKPDIHDDKTFTTQSFAMQTAAHRQSLSPIPSLDLLDPAMAQKTGYSPAQLQQLSELLEIKLKEFNVNAQVMNVVQGPIVTSFEVALAAGVKASKVTGIAQDLARSLSMASLRVVEVIAGKPYIGIEIPNRTKQTVKLIELLSSPQYQNKDNQIAMAMGKDIGGKTIITDLAKAPHMLVAGTTGSGKSVLVNAMLLSMLLKYTPDELRLILIDPKMLELANYSDIPHLLTPVVTDMTEAASALSWCVGEMERRYQLMSLLKVRKLSEFNKKVKEAELRGEPILDPLWRLHDSVSQDKPSKLKPLPLIVVVADEFADMIMQVGKQAEELITRLAQKSRAAGIHLMLATQRPSVDVITGLIKANIPSRAALRVNSKVDSRTILDAGGAEDMLGHGDMLFLAPGKNEPMRVHGAYVTDEEVNRVCDAWRERGSPDYIETVATTSFELGESRTSTSGEDVLYDEALAFIMDSGKTSISALQRRLSIGYNRAANIIESMEKNGVLSPPDNSGKRQIVS